MRARNVRLGPPAPTRILSHGHGLPAVSRRLRSRLHCPQCDVRLVFRDQGRGGRRSFGAWQQTAWGRIFIGLLLAQGLYYGLRHLCVAGLLATNFADAEALGASVTGLLLLQGLQVVSLFIGGIFAGPARRTAPSTAPSSASGMASFSSCSRRSRL